MAHDVFISYSHHDKATADAVCAKLEQHHVRCWVAPRDVVPGAEWAGSIIQALDNTRVMVLVFSAQANESLQIRKEVERAVNKGVIIVPLRIEDVVPTHALEYFMSDVHWLDALTPPFEKHLDHLAGTVKMLLERAETEDVEETYYRIRPGLTREPAGEKDGPWLGIVPRAQLWRFLTGLAITTIAAAGGFFSWRYFHPPLKIPRLAVIGPTNNSGTSKFDYMSTQIGDIVSVNLSQASQLNAVPRQDIAQYQEDTSIPSDPCSGDVHPAPMQDLVAASYLIFGSFRQNTDPRAGSLHSILCLLDSNGKVLGTFEQDRNEDTMGDFAELAADHFRKIIGDAKLAPQDFRNVFPRDPTASRLYFEGVANIRSFNASKARDALQVAARNEDSSPMIHFALAQAWSLLRKDAQAKDEANLAKSLLPADFPLEFVILIQAGAAEMNRQWNTALDFYASLYKSFPERLDFGLKVASVQIKASQPGLALATLQGLARLPRPLGQDPRILIEKSKALVAQADFRGGIQAAQEALIIAKERKFQVMQANANLQLCWAYQRAGEIDHASSACDEAQQTFRRFNDDVSAAVALNDIATWLTERDRYSEAKQDFDEVIAIHENADDQIDLAGALINRAKVSLRQSHLEEAERDLTRAREIASSIPGDTDDEAIALTNLAEVSRQRGQMKDVVKQASQARDLAHNIPDPDVEATALSALALGETETGQLSNALKDNNSLLKMRTDPAQVATTLSRIGDIFLRMGDFPDARKSYQDALDGFARAQKPDDSAQALLNLSEVDLDEGHFADSENKATRALRIFVEQNDQDSQADALASLLRALVGQGPSRFPEAKDRLKTLLAVKFADREVGFDVALAEGTLLVATGDANEALGLLRNASSDADALGLKFTALQLGLAAVPAMEKSGDRAGARKTLAAIRASAQRLGFTLISNEARDLAVSLGL